MGFSGYPDMIPDPITEGASPECKHDWTAPETTAAAIRKDGRLIGMFCTVCKRQFADEHGKPL